MFMIPMPPTNSEIDATIASKAAITELLLFCASAIWLRLRTLKSGNWPVAIWWRRLSVAVTCAMAVSTIVDPAACT